MNSEALIKLEKRYFELGQELAEARRAVEPESVSDHEFQTPDGPVSLSSLFGQQDDLIVIHNMGEACRYCTLWPDGFIRLHDHLRSGTAFVVSSLDSHDVHRDVAASPGGGPFEWSAHK